MEFDAESLMKPEPSNGSLHELFSLVMNDSSILVMNESLFNASQANTTDGKFHSLFAIILELFFSNFLKYTFRIIVSIHLFSIQVEDYKCIQFVQRQQCKHHRRWLSLL